MTLYLDDRQLYRLARTAQGMTQTALAAGAGTARECVNRFEKGTESLSPRTYYRMALGLNFSPTFLQGLRTCPFSSNKLIKMTLPDAGAETDYAMIHFLAEHCRRLEVVFLWGRFRSRPNAPSPENHVRAIVARDNEGNLFLFKRKPDGPLREPGKLEETAGKIGKERNNRIVFGQLRIDCCNAALSAKIAKWTAEKKDVEDLFGVIGRATSAPCPCSRDEMKLIRMLREKNVSAAMAIKPLKEGLRARSSIGRRGMARKPCTGRSKKGMITTG
jgi:transcriptional regulator with XRE-family HTH domain